jgi:hypothetical protein
MHRPFTRTAILILALTVGHAGASAAHRCTSTGTYRRGTRSATRRSPSGSRRSSSVSRRLLLARARAVDLRAAADRAGEPASGRRRSPGRVVRDRPAVAVPPRAGPVPLPDPAARALRRGRLHTPGGAVHGMSGRGAARAAPRSASEERLVRRHSVRRAPAKPGGRSPAGGLRRAPQPGHAAAVDRDLPTREVRIRHPVRVDRDVAREPSERRRCRQPLAGVAAQRDLPGGRAADRHAMPVVDQRLVFAQCLPSGVRGVDHRAQPNGRARGQAPGPGRRDRRGRT